MCALILTKGCYKVFRSEFIDIKCRIYGTLRSNTFYNFARARAPLTHIVIRRGGELLFRIMRCILLYT